MKDLILSYIVTRDLEGLKTLLVQAEHMEIMQAFYELPGEDLVKAFRLLSKDVALNVFEELDMEQQQNLLSYFTDESTIEFVNEMAPDDRVKLLGEMPAKVAKKLLDSISPKEREATNILMGYAPETAGHIMTTEFISLTKDMTQKEALEKVCRDAKDRETIYVLFVTDRGRRLEGVITLKELLVADSDAILVDIMAKKPISVFTDQDQEDVAKTLQKLDLLAIPVVDSEERIVGIVTIDDAVDILEEEATEDIYDNAGLADITGNESDRSDVLINGSLWKIWKVRLPFLLATMGLGLVSGLVIQGFEATLESIAVVAIFIPVIMGMGGNIGTQSSTVFARGVVLGHIQINSFLRPFLKEIGIGLSIGTLVGIIAGAVATLWLDMPMLGVAVGLAMVVTMTVAALLGFLVPYVLIKLNVDQAAGSAPIITTLKDLVALVIYFLCVNLFLGGML